MIFPGKLLNSQRVIWRFGGLEVRTVSWIFHGIFQYVFVLEHGEIIYIAGYEWGFHADIWEI